MNARHKREKTSFEPDMFERGTYVGDSSDWDIEKISLDRYERIYRIVRLLGFETLKWKELLENRD